MSILLHGICREKSETIDPPEVGEERLYLQARSPRKFLVVITETKNICIKHNIYTIIKNNKKE